MKEDQYPELKGYCQMGWFGDLKPWGVIGSYWYNPFTEERAFLYKHKSGSYIVAHTYEEQIEAHKHYGIPLVGEGEHFNGGQGESQKTLF